ncbi:MAG TPA: hypothetical protein VGC39_09255 [Candidatus Methylacidiphilales bacterium]
MTSLVCSTSAHATKIVAHAAAKVGCARKLGTPIKPWTKDDVRSLKAHSKARTPVAKISKQMKRTVGALRRRAGILGIGGGRASLMAIPYGS